VNLRARLPMAWLLLALLGPTMGGCFRSREIVERPTAGEALAALERLEPGQSAEWRSNRDAIIAHSTSQTAQLRTSEPMYFGPAVHRAEVEEWGPSFYAGAGEEQQWLDRALAAGSITKDEYDRLLSMVQLQSRDPLVRQENSFVARPAPAIDLDIVHRAAGEADSTGCFALTAPRANLPRWPRSAMFWIAPGRETQPKDAK
jgi:hypothetical protein